VSHTRFRIGDSFHTAGTCSYKRISRVLKNVQPTGDIT